MNTNIDDIKAGWIADELIQKLDSVGVLSKHDPGLRNAIRKIALKELTLLRIQRLDDGEDPKIWVLTATDSDVKQCFFGFGSYGTGIPMHVDTPEYYGRDLEPEKPNPDAHRWEWRLTHRELAKLVQLWGARVLDLKAEADSHKHAAEIILTEKLMEYVTATMIQ